MSMTILLLVLLIGGVGTIMTGARRLQGRSLTGAMFRQAFQYVLLYALVLVVANGAADLIGRLLGHREPGGDEFLLAQSLTAILIALPIAALLAWWIRHTHRKDPHERQALLYQVYLTATALTAAAMTAEQLSGVLTGLIGSATLHAQALGAVAIWGLIWVVHWRVLQRTLPTEQTVAHLLLGSAIGLCLSAGGLFELLSTALHLLAGPYLIVGTTVELGSAVGTFAAGVVIWGSYWLASASRLPQSTAWHTYVLLLGVTGGLVTLLTGAQALLWHVLVVLVGDRTLYTAWIDWQDAVAAVVIGATVWWYHRAMLEPGRRTSVERVYQYVVCGIGAVTAVAGIGVLVASLIDAVIPASLYYAPINTLLGALTLLGIGTGLWLIHWRRIEDAARLDPAVELTAVIRRIYLVVMIGGPAVAVVIALISGVEGLVQDIVQGQLGVHTFYNVRTELAFLAGSAALIAYHATIVRQDQRTVPPVAASAARGGTITLIGPFNPALKTLLDQQAAGSVRLLAIEDAAAWDLEAVIAAINTYDPDDDIVILARDHGIESHPAAELRYLK